AGSKVKPTTARSSLALLARMVLMTVLFARVPSAFRLQRISSPVSVAAYRRLSGPMVMLVKLGPDAIVPRSTLSKATLSVGGGGGSPVVKVLANGTNGAPVASCSSAVRKKLYWVCGTSGTDGCRTTTSAPPEVLSEAATL